MEAHFDFVWRSLRRLGLNDPDADDGTQEVFLVATRKLDQILFGCERRFLFATAVRVASTRRRSLRRRHEEQLTLASEHECQQNGPERLAEMSRARHELQGILDGMSDDQRSVFIAFELEEMTVPEIAETLTLPIGTVSSRLRAARGYFQSAIARLQAQRTFAQVRS
ncbi:MAG: sigma-70 family RNA polymerase sigma factor [Polyangiaceae bacterium]